MIPSPSVESSEMPQAEASFSQPEAYEAYRQISGMFSGKAGQGKRKLLTCQRELFLGKISVFHNQIGFFKFLLHGYIIFIAAAYT